MYRISVARERGAFILSYTLNSAYKTLGSMVEKMDAQLALARKIRTVDADDVAERVINSHFLPDMIGNLRAFSRQKVRCVKCGAKFRRPLLSDTCPRCHGRAILTVTGGSVKKYLDRPPRVAAEYEVSEFFTLSPSLHRFGHFSASPFRIYINTVSMSSQ